jgi:hypothetical protein
MTGGRVRNVIECFARDCDYMRLAKFELLGCFETERKALHRPPENSLPNLTPLWANRNFSNNGSDSAAIGILERHMNIAVYLDC